MAMEESVLLAQAEAVASLMPKLARSLFAGNNDAAADLPLGQLRVCGILEDGPRSMSALSRELTVSLSAMTQIADRLERSEWVRRVPEDGDRRVRCLQLTPRGEAMMRERKKGRVQRVLTAMERLSPDERAQVLQAFEALARASVASQTRDAARAAAGTEPARSAGPPDRPTTVSGALG
jgi:DNA-binding MarR family transcriptional regulator